MPYGTLYLVPTPIGNLEDITLRALRTLKEADAVLCEDTRVSVKLLNHFAIAKPLVSFYAHNQVQRIPQVMRDLKSGKNLALISDGGTPGISDPGYFLIVEALKENIPVVPLPGPCACVTALVGSGMPSDGFTFLGFLKRKPGKMKKELRQAAAAGKTIVFYESPHRIGRTMTVLEAVFAPEAATAVGRELTKKFEEFIRGPLSDVAPRLRGREVLGELVVIIEPKLNAAPDEKEIEDTEEDNEDE